MTTPNGEQFAEGRYRSRELAVDLPSQLELLSRSHRTFCARAAQELHRAERYRQYLSLVIVHGDHAGLGSPSDPYQDLRGPLADLCAAIRTACRISDVVSGVEGGKFAVLLVETSPEGAQRFCVRLKENIQSLFIGRSASPARLTIPVELITFPDQPASRTTMSQTLHELYRRSNIRPHLA